MEKKKKVEGKKVRRAGGGHGRDDEGRGRGRGLDEEVRRGAGGGGGGGGGIHSVSSEKEGRRMDNGNDKEFKSCTI